ncbi:MAG: EF-hand domain-containing protein [Planctomycetota bacterium]|jgi:hypothetical protein
MSKVRLIAICLTFGLVLSSVSFAGKRGRGRGSKSKSVVNTKKEAHFDKNDDGRVGRREARQMKRSTRRADKNNDGTVDSTEKEKAQERRETISEKREVDTKKEEHFDKNDDGDIGWREARRMKNATKKADTDKDGTISDDEKDAAKEKWENLKEKREVDTDIEEKFDLNGDGKIDRKEAKKMWQAKRKKEKAEDDDDDDDDD